MTSRLGVYWSVMHRRPTDYDYFKRLQPTVFKIMDGGEPDYRFARENLPNSLVIARDWALSEQHSDMLKDPVGTGRRHANEWNEHQKRLGFDKAKTLILGINEPRIWEPGVSEALRQYTIALCDEATKLGLRVGAMQLSVGWPNNTGADTPPDWSPWQGVDNAIRANNGALVLHEYWADKGCAENWGWWAGRSLKCPWQVPLVVGECGIDMYVKDPSVQHETRGWLGRKSPEQYASELAEYVGMMSADSRFVGCAVFASDFANREWASFDVEPAYQAILSTPAPVIPTTPLVTTHLPLIGNGKSFIAHVIVPSGANIRTAPDVETGEVVEVVPYGDAVTVNGFDVGSDRYEWAMVQYFDRGGWMRSDLLSAEPEDASQGDNWSRAYPEVLKFEGGLSLDPNDPGNYYQGKLVGTKYGISAAVWGGQYDIPNLTKEQALEIYRKHYWQASGADQLPWPMSLIVLDTAVNHGVGVARQLLTSQPTPEEIYLGQRGLRYFDDPNWTRYGVAWGNRVNRLHEITEGA